MISDTHAESLRRIIVAISSRNKSSWPRPKDVVLCSKSARAAYTHTLRLRASPSPHRNVPTSAKHGCKSFCSAPASNKAIEPAAGLRLHIAEFRVEVLWDESYAVCEGADVELVVVLRG
jgi:hypothetical protein